MRFSCNSLNGRSSYFWYKYMFPLLRMAALFSLISQCTSEKSNIIGVCNLCCPSLFNNQEGIVSVRQRSALLHTISYIQRCIFFNEEVVLVSDDFLIQATSINMQRNRDDSVRRSCSYPENMPISFLTAEFFLQANISFFLQFNIAQPKSGFDYHNHTINMRTNFIFTSGSSPQMEMLLAKVDEMLEYLRSNSKLVWQPIIVFLWSETLQVFRNEEKISRPSKELLKVWFLKNQSNFSIDSGIFFFFMVQKGNSTRSQSNLFLSLFEAYTLKRKFVLREVTEQGSFPQGRNNHEPKSCEDGKEISSTIEKINWYIFLERCRRRSNFKQLPIVASIQNAPGYSDWFEIKQGINGSNVTLERGFSVSIYRDMEVIMNFSEEVVLMSRDPFQRTSPSQSQPVRPLQSQVEDISLNQASVYPERAQAYTFLQPTYSGIYKAFFQQPSANSIRNIVSAPFKISLWITLISTWILLIGCVHGWGWIAKRNGESCYSKDAHFVKEIGMWTIAVTCQKSWYACPTTTIFKTIFYIGSLMALVSYVAYSATIVSFLTVKILAVKSFEDLIERDFKFTVHEYSGATKLLLEEMIGTFSLSQKVITTNTENEITHIIDGKNAFLSYPDLFYQTAAGQNFTEKFLCSNIYSLPAQNVPYKSSMFVNKGSQFHELFSEKLLIILERGLNYRYKNAYDSKSAVTCVKQQYDDGHIVVDPVHITDVFTAFLVIFTGWIMAVWIFFSERLYHRRRVYYLIFVFA